MCWDVLRQTLIDLGIDDSQVVDTAHLFADLKLDSTEAVEVSLSLKKALGVSLDFDSRSDPCLREICDKVEEDLARVRAEQTQETPA